MSTPAARGSSPGSPIAPTERVAEVCARFVAAAAAPGRRVCCFGTEARFAMPPAGRRCAIGDQPIWAPATGRTSSSGSRSLREQLRRARAKGVVVRAIARDELAPDHPTRGESMR